MLSDPPHLALTWAPYHEMDVETLVFSASNWLKTTCILAALFWYVYSIIHAWPPGTRRRTPHWSTYLATD